ncbi:hypothetical protein LEP1GSC073_4065 [Leptospira noguchii str. Cascata]|nr:hypothetical protein LEP1GSC073_4065 [Leptospira noguchii str. Cascata]
MIFINRFLKCGNPQTTILRTNSKITFKKSFLVFLHRTHVILKFCESSHILSFLKQIFYYQTSGNSSHTFIFYEKIKFPKDKV